MKLLLVPEGPVSYDGEEFRYSAGEGIYIDNLSRYFDEVILCAYAFLPGDDDYFSTTQYSFQSTNIRFVRLPFSRSPNAGIFSKLYQLILVTWVIFFQMRKCDVMYLFMPGYPAAISYLLSKLIRKPYLLYLASMWQEESEVLFRWGGIKRKLFMGIFHKFNGWIEKSAVRSSIAVLTAGRSTLEYYRQDSTTILETIPRLNWPNIKIFSSRKNQVEAKEVLYVGALLSRKGVDYLIGAISLLNNVRGRSFNLTVIGSGPDVDRLEKMAINYGLKKSIRFLGFIDNGPCLYDKYRESDLFVLPTPYGEGFPRVIYEALSQGLPTIATKVSGVPLKVIHGETAILVEPRSSEALADAIEDLANDIGLRNRMSKNGIDFMQKVMGNQDSGAQINSILLDKFKSYKD